LLVDVFTPLVREKHVQAMQAAQNEYRKWVTDPCAYQPPAGFSYDARSACTGVSQLFRPESPGLRAFVAYGAKQVFENAGVNDPRTGGVFWATSNAALLGYGYAAALGLGVAGAAVGAALPASTFTAIFPYILYLGDWTLSGAGAAALPASTAAGASGAASIGGTLLIVIGAVTTAVVAGISVFNEAALPSQLQEMIDRARTYDIGVTLRNCNYPTMCISATSSDLRSDADKELYAAFILTTLPDYPGTEPAPATKPGEPGLVVAGSPVDWLQYTAVDGSQRAVRLSGRWFADRAGGAGAGEARLTLFISYQDAAGAKWTARRVGNQFLIVRTDIPPTRFDYPAPRQSADLSVVDWSGRTVTAQMAR
jgi:hypothetical protein